MAGDHHPGMAFQFVHMENFSVKGDRKGRSTSFVFAEARRDPVASQHVSTPLPPVVIFGSTIDDVEQRHDDLLLSARTTRQGPKGVKDIAVRKDQHTLVTVIMSHPYTVQEVQADPAKKAEVLQWERLNVEWLKQQHGDDLASVIRHEDEAQHHLHAYVLPSDRAMKASLLHPGQVAKAAVTSAGHGPGEDDKAVIRRSDRAYKKAMRRWQDDYYDQVSARCGLTRIGPGLRRLPREQWHAEKQQAAALQKALGRANQVKSQGDAFVGQKREEAQKIIAEATRLKAEADIRSAAALRTQDAAEKARLRALQEQERAGQAMKQAKRLAGVGGAFRGLWDGLRKSSIVARVRAEIAPQIERWQAAISSADARAADADRRRRDVEAEAAAVRRSVAQVGAQRDDLRRRLSVYEPTEVSLDVSAGLRRPR